MIRKLFLISLFICFYAVNGWSQSIVKTSDLFAGTESNSKTGKLNIIQDPALDTLMSRYILGFKNLEEKNGSAGMEGFRIQIFSSSNRNAKDESNKVNAEFINKFPESKYPELKSYVQFAQPAYYKIRVGNFRTRTEATRLYLLINKVFPDAYIVPDIINFQDLNNK
jgi:hypothetical protein